MQLMIGSEMFNGKKDFPKSECKLFKYWGGEDLWFLLDSCHNRRGDYPDEEGLFDLHYSKMFKKFDLTPKPMDVQEIYNLWNFLYKSPSRNWIKSQYANWFKLFAQEVQYHSVDATEYVKLMVELGVSPKLWLEKTAFKIFNNRNSKLINTQ